MKSTQLQHHSFPHWTAGYYVWLKPSGVTVLSCRIYHFSPKCKLIERFWAKWVIVIILFDKNRVLHETLEAGTTGVKDCSGGKSIGVLWDQNALLMPKLQVLSDPDPSSSFLSRARHGRHCSPIIHRYGSGSHLTHACMISLRLVLSQLVRMRDYP